MATGVVQPKLVVGNMIEQFDNLIAEGVEGLAPSTQPVKEFPDEVPAGRARRGCAPPMPPRSATGIIPPRTRVRDFLKTEYLPRARDSVGLSGMPGATGSTPI